VDSVLVNTVVHTESETCQKQCIQPYSLRPNRRPSPRIHPSLLFPLQPTTRNPYNLTLCVPAGVDHPTYNSHSQYIQPYSRVPTGIDLPTHASHSQYIPSYSLQPNRRRSPHIYPSSPLPLLFTKSVWECGCVGVRVSVRVCVGMCVRVSVYACGCT